MVSVPLPHGAWPTPITSELVVRAAAVLGEVVVDGDDVWWSESRPAEVEGGFPRSPSPRT